MVARQPRSHVGLELVTRERLAEWGFVPMPNVWLPSPLEGRRSYFERWYHPKWNYTALIGWPGKDPLAMTEDDFLASLQAHVLEDDDVFAYDPWDDTLCGF